MPIAVIDPADIAAVAAVVLTQPGHAGVAHALSGPEPLTPGEQIAQLADVLRRPLRYQPQSDDEAREDLTATGTAPGVVDAFFRFFSDGEFDDARVVDTVERLTGRPPRTFAQWARAHRHQLDGSGNGQAVPGTTRD